MYQMPTLPDGIIILDLANKKEARKGNRIYDQKTIKELVSYTLEIINTKEDY